MVTELFIIINIGEIVHNGFEQVGPAAYQGIGRKKNDQSQQKQNDPFNLFHKQFVVCMMKLKNNLAKIPHE